MGVKQESADSALYAKVKEVDLRGEEMLMTVMRILIGVIQRTARRCVLGVEILNILLSFASQTCLMTSSTAFLNHFAHIATIDQDDHSNDDLFAFAVDHRPNRLATAFSKLALTEFTDSTNSTLPPPPLLSQKNIFFQIKFIVLQGQSLGYTSKLPEGRSRGTGPEQAVIKLDHTTRAT